MGLDLLLLEACFVAAILDGDRDLLSTRGRASTVGADIRGRIARLRPDHPPPDVSPVSWRSARMTAQRLMREARRLTIAPTGGRGETKAKGVKGGDGELPSGQQGIDLLDADESEVSR